MNSILLATALMANATPHPVQTATIPVPSSTPVPVARAAPQPAPRRLPAKRKVSLSVARVTSANRAVTIEPQAQGFVNTAQVFPFSDSAIYRAYVAPGAVTDIVLQPS